MNDKELLLWPRHQLNFSLAHFHFIFHFAAAIAGAEFGGFLLHEAGEGIEGCRGGGLVRVQPGGGKGVKEFADGVASS